MCAFWMGKVNHVDGHTYDMLACFDGHTGSYASYLVPAAALGAMGYCYMWWKVMFLIVIQMHQFCCHEW